MYTNLFLPLLGLAAGVTEAFFVMSCPGRLVRERLDPIVNPGGLAGHVHQIAGGAGFSAEMSYDDARAAKCTSCPIKEDLSNYWTPELYVQYPNGTFSPVPVVGDADGENGGMTVYYLQRRGDNSTEQLHAFPKGFRMLAGDPTKRNFTDDSPAKAISYACLGAGDKPETNGFPSYNCPYSLRAQVFFPSCWNGRNLDSPDHKSHMSYPMGKEYNTGDCPPSHPIHMVSLFFEVLYDINRFASLWNGTNHPFTFSQGDATGYGFHGDFVNGWDVDVLQRAVNECDDVNGRIEQCPHLSMHTREENQACRLPSTVTERVSGILPKLPGCNTVTHGPERAVSRPCGDNATLGAYASNFVDLTTTRHWAYAGCGVDSPAARAFAYSVNEEHMTVQACVDTCTKNNNTIAALEFGRECWCGDELREENKPKEGILGGCTMKCGGDAEQVCGGPAAMSVYRKCEDGKACGNYVFGRSMNATRA